MLPSLFSFVRRNVSHLLTWTVDTSYLIHLFEYAVIRAFEILKYILCN